MPFKPNYNQQRRDRQLAKEQKLQQKLQKREERRKAELGEGENPEGNETPEGTDASEEPEGTDASAETDTPAEKT